MLEAFYALEAHRVAATGMQASGLICVNVVLMFRPLSAGAQRGARHHAAARHRGTWARKH
jgi:hypothetical protein